MNEGKEYYCEECKEMFDDGFEYVDHFTEDDEEFDPALILPNGYRLQVGSMLRFIYANADKPEQIRRITQATYVTLFAAERELEVVEDMIEDMVVQSEMLRFEESLKTLLEERKPNEEEGGE